MAEDVTILLGMIRDGEPGAADRLFDLLYDELKKLALVRLRGESPHNSLNATALLHEAYLRMVAGSDRTWENRQHFFASAAEAMRRIIIDHARSRNSLKRGGGWKEVPLPEQPAQEPEVDLLALNEALDDLEKKSTRLSLVVKCRYFLRMTLDQIAGLLEVSESTIRHDWNLAKAILRRSMGGGDTAT